MLTIHRVLETLWDWKRTWNHETWQSVLIVNTLLTIVLFHTCKARFNKLLQNTLDTERLNAKNKGMSKEWAHKRPAELFKLGSRSRIKSDNILYGRIEIKEEIVFRFRHRLEKGFLGRAQTNDLTDHWSDIIFNPRSNAKKGVISLKPMYVCVSESSVRAPKP